MAIRGESRTLGAEVYEQLRNRILSGELAPGSPLRPSVLRGEYEVSVSVVREALTRLTEQQLAVAEPNLGFTVAALSRKDLNEIVQVRAELEAFAIKLSIENGDIAWESELMSAHHTLARAPIHLDDESTNPAWIAAHAAFHAQLIAGCGNDKLRGICASLYQSSELYRLWSDPTLHDRDAPAEHRALLSAAIERNAPLAAELLTAHIETTRDLALRNIGALHEG